MMLSKSHCQIEHTILGGGFTYFLFSPCLGKIPILTSIFLIGWNHQPEYIFIHLEKGPVLSAMLASQKATTSSQLTPVGFLRHFWRWWRSTLLPRCFFFGLISWRLNLWWKTATSSHGCKIRNAKLAIYHDMVKWHWFSQWWKWIAVCPLHITKNCLTCLGIWVAHPTNPCELMSLSRSINWKLRPVRWRDNKNQQYHDVFCVLDLL